MINMYLTIAVKWIYKNLLIMHFGSVYSKIKSTFYLSLIISPIAFFLEKVMEWLSLNYEYVGFVVAAILIDHLIGSWVHAVHNRDFTIKKNIQGLFTKCALVLLVGILVEGFHHIVGVDNFLTDYFSVISRLMVFIYPAGSALMNCAIITKGKFPPVSWMVKLNRFNKEMTLESFKPKSDEEVINE